MSRPHERRGPHEAGQSENKRLGGRDNSPPIDDEDQDEDEYTPPCCPHCRQPLPPDGECDDCRDDGELLPDFWWLE